MTADLKNEAQKALDAYDKYESHRDALQFAAAIESLRKAVELQAPAEAHGDVLVPLTVLEDASSSLGHYLSDLGWSDEDMQAMDNLDAYIARHKANAAAQAAHSVDKSADLQTRPVDKKVNLQTQGDEPAWTSQPQIVRNLLESCANWLESRSHSLVLHIQPDPEEGGGYASLMREYAKNLRELNAVLTANVQPKGLAVAWARQQFIHDDAGFGIGTDDPELYWGEEPPDGESDWHPLYAAAGITTRDAALEEAAQLCELWNTAPGRKLAGEIRALASQAPAPGPCISTQPDAQRPKRPDDFCADNACRAVGGCIRSPAVGAEPVRYPHPDEDDPVTLWKEIRRLRAAMSQAKCDCTAYCGQYVLHGSCRAHPAPVTISHVPVQGSV